METGACLSRDPRDPKPDERDTVFPFSCSLVPHKAVGPTAVYSIIQGSPLYFPGCSEEK